MLNNIPVDLLILIINTSCNTPIEYLTLRNTNKQIYSIVNTFTNLFENKLYNYEEDIDNICRKSTSVTTFKWIFKNKIQFSLKNVKNLILYNRVDVFTAGLMDEHFFKIIFNRFYIHLDTQNDIFSFIESKNPLVIAGIHNRIEIIKILLMNKHHKNPYLNIITVLLDISIKYNHKNLLSYLIINHFSSIEDSIQRKLITIIYRISKCEDILFYLMVNQKIILNQRHFNGLILMGYNGFFIKYHPMFGSSNDLLLLQQITDTNNTELFNYMIEKNRKYITSNYLTKVLFPYDKKKKFSKDFIYNLLNNYIDLIDKKNRIITLCLINEIEALDIIKLVNDDFFFTDEDMEIVLEKREYLLLENMCRKITN